MTKLPSVSGRDLIKALAKIGDQRDHQKGSISFCVTGIRLTAA